MSEQFTRSFDQEQPTLKKKIETKKDPNGFRGKNVYEIRQKVEKMNKPEAKEFFDFWWLITQNKNGKKGMNIHVNTYSDWKKNPKTGKLEEIKNTSKLRENTSTEYQTFQGNSLTIYTRLWGDLDTDDDHIHIDTKKEPDWQSKYDHDYDYDEKNQIDFPIPTYDPSRHENEFKIQLLPNGTIMIQEKTDIFLGNTRKNPERSQPKVIDGQRAADFITHLKNKFLERYVNRKDDRGITDDDLNMNLDQLIGEKSNH